MQRPLWSRLRPCRVSQSSTPLSAARSLLQDPLTIRSQRWGRLSGAEYPRPLATIAEAIQLPDRYIYVERPAEERSLLDNVLRAVQGRDVAATARAFFAWTDVLGNTEHSLYIDTVNQFLTLPSTALSEIIRSMDPVERPELDVAYGLNITQGQSTWMDTSHLVNERGIRNHHQRVCDAMRTIMWARPEGGLWNPLRIHDYEVFMRCAGAATDFEAAKLFFAQSKERSGLYRERTTKTWTEFIKARFLTEPAYYQFDRARVIVDSRDLVQKGRAPGYREKRRHVRLADGLRHSKHAFKVLPWNLKRNQLLDMRRMMRRRAPLDHRAFSNHWMRTHSKGYAMDEELLCAAMIAYSRSNDTQAILDSIFKLYYAIEVDVENSAISGGIELDPSSAIYPTTKLLNSIVDTFGGMSDISLGMQLLDYVSQRYDIPIPHSAWTNLLNWAYVAASKSYRKMRIKMGANDTSLIMTSDVRHIWDLMISPPYNIKPSFDDLCIYIRVLLIQRELFTAEHAIRQLIVPHLETLNEEYESALFDEILQIDADILGTSTSTASATHRRLIAETRRSYANYWLSTWLDELLTQASHRRAHRSKLISTTIPSLIRDFPNHFLPSITYRTDTAVVTLKGHHDKDIPRFTSPERQVVIREIKGQRLSGIEVQERHQLDHEGRPLLIEDAGWDGDQETQIIPNPDYEWPTAPDMKVVEKRHLPSRRVTKWARPPRKGDGHKKWLAWWVKLERQMMML